MKILPSNSTLLVIDIQERLLPKIYDGGNILKDVLWSVELAKTLDIPHILTEHCPSKIGTTPSELREKFTDNSILEKVHFSAVSEGNLINIIDKERKQIIVVGTEAHVCLQQTVLDLLTLGFQVFVLESAVGSRFLNDKERALTRMAQNGAEIITRDMLAFEWLIKADSEKFREVLQNFIK